MFYTRFAPKMKGVIRRYVDNAEDVEDILHDGFIVAFTRMRDVKEPSRIQFWLASIMRNLALQFLREQDINVVLHEIPEVEDAKDLEDIIDLDVLEAMIRKLPPGYGKVFRLSVLENKSHKEIAGILGIEPSTSASQLFHAKVMMRQFIRDYKKQAGMLVLLFLVMTGGIMTYFVSHRQNETVIAEASGSRSRETDQSNSREIDQSNSSKIEQRNQSNHSNLVALNSPISPNLSITPITPTHPTTPTASDSLSHTEPVAEDAVEATSESVSEVPPETYPALAYELPKRKAAGWTVGVGTDFVGTSIKSGLGNGDLAASDPGRPPGNPEDPDNPDNSDNPDNLDNSDNTDNTTRSGIRKVGQKLSKNYSEVSHRNYVPVTVSVSVSKRFNSILSLESGLRYTYLHSAYESGKNESHCHWHYIGIPLKLNINTYTRGIMSLYGSIGASVNFPVYSHGVLRTGFNSSGEVPVGDLDAKVMWAVSASYGISLRLHKNVSVFLEPTLQYMPKVNTNVPNYWTETSWNFALPLGIRFNW